MKFVKLTLSGIIVLTAVLGDYIVFRSKYSSSIAFRAVSDSLVHGSLGFLSSLVFLAYEISLSWQSRLLNVVCCTVLSCIIDIDHVIVARSLNLKDLTNLKQRGMLHCTTFWLLATLIILSYSFLHKRLNLYLMSFMVILAFTSHHIRDGNRRGLWLYPFGSSPAIDKNLYVFLLAVLPHVFAYFYLTFKVGFSKHAVDYSMIV